MNVSPYLPLHGGVEGVGDARPLLAWRLSGTGSQTAYRVVVGSYDSGKTPGAVQSHRLPILPADASLTATVTVWDDTDTAASGSVVFSTGLRALADWAGARWIGLPGTPAPQLRKTLTHPGGEALLHVAARGTVAVYVNGTRVSHGMDPGFPVFAARTLARTYRVTLTAGENVIGIRLGRGWAGIASQSDWSWDTASYVGSPRVLVRLGDVVSDASWKASTGDVRYDDPYYGEVIDPAAATPGWESAGFNDASWAAATVLADPGRAVVPARHHPERIASSLIAPTATSTVSPGGVVHRIFDFGRIRTGTARVTITGDPGAVVSIAHAEKLNGAGYAELSNSALKGSGNPLMGVMQTDVVTLPASGTATVEATVSVLKSGRYVDVWASSGSVSAVSAQWREIVADMPARASFSSSDPLVDTLFGMVEHTVRLNSHMGFLSDTPCHEMLGWTGDTVTTRDAQALILDVLPVWRQWHEMMLDEHQHRGIIPVVVPAPETIPMPIDHVIAPEWHSAVWLLPVRGYQITGDAGWIAETYDRMVEAMRWLLSRKGWGRLGGIPADEWTSEYGDWSAPGGIYDGGKDASATGHVILGLQALAQAATILGRTTDAAEWQGRADTERAAWAGRLWNASSGRYRPKSGASELRQTPTLLAYELGVEPAAHGTAPLTTVMDEAVTSGFHIAGMAGEPSVLHALSDLGRGADALTMLKKTSFPSWGQWATYPYGTTWDGFGTPEQNRTLSHHYHGSYGSWIITRLAGIRPTGPGQVTIAPSYLLAEVDATADTGRGPVRVRWDADTLTVTIPPGVTATYQSATLPAGVHSFPR